MVVNFMIWEILLIFMLVYVMFFYFGFKSREKSYFTNLANPKNPYLNLDSPDYSCAISLVIQH